MGLLEPVIWNKRTGNVVGGHQRLKCLDLLEQRADYLVPVAAVDLDEVTERRQNVFLNNAEAQGDWDLLLLADCLKGIPEPELTGFDRGDLYQLFGCDPTLTDVAPDVPRGPAPAPSPAPVSEAPEPVGRADQEWERRRAEGRDREQGDFYRVIVFGSDDEAAAFDHEFGLGPGRYIDPKTLVRKIRGESDE